MQSRIQKVSQWANSFFRPAVKTIVPKIITVQNPIAENTFTQYTSATPKYAYSLELIEQVARESDVLVAIHKALRMEIFRNGFEISEAKNVEEDTGLSAEETNITQKSEGEEEENNGLESNQKKEILKKTEIVNEKGESLQDVLEQLEDDYNTFDLAFLFFRFEYGLQNGEVVSKVFQEARRLNPKTMNFVVNNRHEFGKDNEDNDLMVSPFDRTRIQKNVQVDGEGRKLYPAHYVQKTADGEYYFFEWEIVHDSRYRPELLTGFSPVITCWNKVSTLSFQDLMMLEWYRGKRPPKGLLAIYAHPEVAAKAWETMIQKVQENPNIVPAMAVPPSVNGATKPIEFINFMPSMDEMQFTDVRNEFRRQIGAVFGVLPLWQGDLSQSGGLNNEGLQITVTSRAVEYAQERYNRKFLRAFVNAIGYEGWIIRLNPSEEQDEMAKLQRQSQSLQNGQLAVSLGLQCEYDENTGEVKIKPGPLKQSAMNPLGNNPFDDGLEGKPEASENKITKPKNTPEPTAEVGKSDTFAQEALQLTNKVIDTFAKKEEKFIVTTETGEKLEIEIV